MQQAVTFATPDAPTSGANRLARRLALSAATAAIASTLLAAGGCAGRDSGVPREPRPRPTTQTQPATRELVPETPQTRPATRPVEPDVAEAPPTRPATQPSTQPTTQPATGPATRPVTLPTTAESPATEPATTQAAQVDEVRLLLVESPTPQGAAVAEIMSAYAELLAGGGGAEDSATRQAALLMEAAVRLAPRDARMARNLVSVQMAAGNVPAALEALEHYRKLRPEDVLAQIRYVDLSASRMEAADVRVDYLIRVAQSDQVPEEVRSHAAAMASIILREMLDEQRADLLLEEAVRLDPYSPQALQMFYERLVAMGEPRARRIDALAMLARSNILQPAVLSALAQEVAATGLLEPATDLYRRAAQVHAALGIAVPPELVRDAAALNVVTNRPQAARQMLSQMESEAFAPPAAEAGQPATAPQGPRVPGIADVDGLMLQPLTAEGTDARATAAARSANLIRAFGLMPINRALVGLAPAPADPATVPEMPLPDVVADAQKLASPQLPLEQLGWRDVYAASLANLAWIDLYFRAQPTDPRILEALRVLASQDSLALARLEGWQLWRQGEADAATQRLGPIAQRDALAQLGLLLMSPPVEAGEWATAQELLDGTPNGLVGAFISDALRPAGIGVLPAKDAPEVREALATLPMALFEMLEPEQVREFYSLTADPQKVRHEYGDPVLVDVALRNSGDYPITIGPEGLLRPYIRLDALVRGQAGEEVPVPAAQIMEIWGSVRLDPSEKIEQTVRLDGPQASALLLQEPQMSLTMIGELTTNPATALTESGRAHVTGPAGSAQRLRRVVTRNGFPLELSDQRVMAAFGERMEKLRTGEPAERIRMAQWAMGQIESIDRAREARRQAGAAPEEIQQLGNLSQQMSGTLARAGASLGATGPEAAANAWVKYCAARVSPPGEGRGRLIRELLASPEFEARLVGLIAAANLADDAQLTVLLEPLAANDPDPTIRSMAKELAAPGGRRAATAPAAELPTTQLTTQPATGPSTQPVP